jgi:hypothetical protein
MSPGGLFASMGLIQKILRNWQEKKISAAILLPKFSASLFFQQFNC